MKTSGEYSTAIIVRLLKLLQAILSEQTPQLLEKLQLVGLIPCVVEILKFLFEQKDKI